MPRLGWREVGDKHVDAIVERVWGCKASWATDKTGCLMRHRFRVRGCESGVVGVAGLVTFQDVG